MAFTVEMAACGCTEILVLHVAPVLVEPVFGSPFCFTNVHVRGALEASHLVDDIDCFTVNRTGNVPTLTCLEAFVGFLSLP